MAITPEGVAEVGAPRARSSERAALAGFALVAAAASGLFGFLGRRVWFFNDEWDFIAQRRAGSVRDLLRPHYGHWSTLPILVYRLLWWTVGLRSYLPYQVLIIALHVIAACLVRCVIRRAGVRPWIATVTASILLLFGRGYQDIVWAFQITQVGSLVFGLTHLLLVDHDGRFDRRDWLGLAAGAAGMLCSGVAVTMVIVVGIAALIRRGRRIAVIHTVPLGVLYVGWWYGYARGSYSTRGVTPYRFARFIIGTIVNVARAAGSLDVVAVLIGALLIVGVCLAWKPMPRSQWSREAAAPFALLVGVVVYLAITAFGRAGLPGATYRSRYLDLSLAMLLPSLGIAAEAVVRRWRTATVVVLAVLVVGIPGNVRAIAAYTHNQQRRTTLFRRTVFALPRLPAAGRVPRSIVPLTPFTIGWLLDGAASGRIPAPSPTTAAERAEDRLRLVLRRTRAAGRHGDVCRAVSRPVPVHLRLGEALHVAGDAVTLAPDTEPDDAGLPFTFDPGGALTPTLGSVSFRVLPTNDRQLARVCGPGAGFS